MLVERRKEEKAAIAREKRGDNPFPTFQFSLPFNALPSFNSLQSVSLPHSFLSPDIHRLSLFSLVISLVISCIAYLLQVSEDATKRKMIFAMNVDGVGLYLPDARVILHSHFNIMFVFLR